ncbi:MAG: hypothetical protein HFE33_01720 [Clostridia bacterium]|jgi:hypothetical protein|nr:hypothetical protein [Clostridia bacterium]
MANFIYSRMTSKDKQTFYLISHGQEYYLFTQKFYRGVKTYFYNKVVLKDALDMSKPHRDTALLRTKRKLLIYLKHVEKENNLIILNQTSNKNNNYNKILCKNSCEYFAG